MSSAGGFIDILFTIDGVTEVSASLATFGRNISNLEPAWTLVGESLLQDFATQFAVEGGVFGSWSEWDALADSTVAERERLGYGGEHPIEVRTGRLRAAVTQQGAPGNVFEATPATLTVGFDDQIGSWQHYGTSKMPARPLVGLSWERRSAIVATLDAFVKQQIAASGLISEG